MSETDMTDYAELREEKAATPHNELIAQLLDSRVPKTEREHAAAREIERLRKLLQDSYRRGYQAGSRGLREMYDAIQEVKRQDAWGNTRLTEALMAAEERAERAEAELSRCRNSDIGQAPDLTHARIAEGLIDRIRELEAKLVAQSLDADGDAEYPQAAKVCAELYQVIGSLASDLGVFDHPKVIKALDNASNHAMVHDDVLPFPSFEYKTAGDALAEMVHEMFRSGNSVPVERITITRKQYDAAMQRTTPQEGSKQ